MKKRITLSLLILIGIVFIASNAFAGKYHPAINYIYPLPESQYNTPLITIILKLDTTYLDDITDLSSLISVIGKTGSYSGDVFFATDNRTIIFKPDQALLYDDTIAVQINTSQFFANDFNYVFYTVNDQESPEESIAQLKSTEIPQKPVSANISMKMKTVKGVSVPEDFPDITTKQTGETAPGLIFFVTHRQRRGIGAYFIVIDNTGKPYYYLKSDEGNYGNATVHPNNVLTLFSYANNCYYVMDTSFAIIDTIYGGHGYYVDSHECQFLKNGHRLTTNDFWLSLPFDTIDTNPQYLQELDTEGNVIFELRSYDFLERHPHMNSIDIDFDGHYILSSRDVNEVTKINSETGEIIWRLGGDQDMFTYINDEYRISQQHDARPLKGYPNHYMIYDNGVTRRGETVATRVVEYVIDTLNMTAEKVWEFSNPEHFTGTMGSSQRFENGNTFIDYPQPATHAFEVNSAGEVIFEMYSTDHESYRCRRFDWYGKMKRPFLLLEDKQVAAQLIFHQFGDSTVDYYKVYFGMDKNNLQVLDSTIETNYFVENLQANSTYYYGITSVNNVGVESEMSELKDQFTIYSAPLENIIRNGDCDDFYGWLLNVDSPAKATRAISNEKLRIEITEPGTSPSDITVIQKEITLINGKKYIFEFDAYADKDRIIEAEISKETSPFTNYSKIGKTYLTTQMQHFKYEFVMEDQTDISAELIFNLGEYIGKVFLDNISLKYVDDNLNEDLFRYAKINFEIPDGYMSLPYFFPDTGSVYGKKWDQETFGWLNENNNFVYRDAMVNALYQSFNYLKKDDVEYTWEIEVPNGAITAIIGMGDPLSTNQINDIYVENTLFPDTDGEDNYDELYVRDIEVEDGKLSIKPGPNAVNAKIAFIEIFYYFEPEVLSTPKTIGHGATYDIHIYPVPATEKIHIQLNLAHKYNLEIELIDMLGRSMDKYSLTSIDAGKHNVAFDIATVPPGIYFLRFTIDGEMLNRKIIIN